MTTPRGLLFLAFSVFIAAVSASLTLSAADIGTTQILQWKDGKKAVIMLGFDDSAPSQLEHVVPELEKRKIVGTFYLVTGNKLYAALQRRWEAAAKSPYVVVANHTFTTRA